MIPAEAVEGEVRAAVEAGGDLDFCIIARTTAIRQVSFARAVERGNASLVFRENLNVSCGI